VFARTITGRTARGRIVEASTGDPILVGDVTVAQGDYVIADASSVAFIPQAEIARVVEAAEMIVRKEALMAQALREGKRASEVMGANYEQMLKERG
jgi:regulator of RNase E activity RraA